MVNFSIMSLYIVWESFPTQVQLVKNESIKPQSYSQPQSVLALKIWFILAD